MVLAYGWLIALAQRKAAIALHLTTSIDIDAAPETVWSVLTDLPAYGEWNPFITEAAGVPAPGERLSLRLDDGEGRPMRFRPTVREATPARELRWLGRLGVRGLFDGEHRFAIEPAGRGSRLTHEEHFTGMLVPLLAKRLRARTRPAFVRMNEALKARVEAAA